jgi:hypothetical protein
VLAGAKMRDDLLKTVAYLGIIGAVIAILSLFWGS